MVHEIPIVLEFIQIFTTAEEDAHTSSDDIATECASTNSCLKDSQASCLSRIQRVFHHWKDQEPGQPRTVNLSHFPARSPCVMPLLKAQIVHALRTKLMEQTPTNGESRRRLISCKPVARVSIEPAATKTPATKRNAHRPRVRLRSTVPYSWCRSHAESIALTFHECTLIPPALDDMAMYCFHQKDIDADDWQKPPPNTSFRREKNDWHFLPPYASFIRQAHNSLYIVRAYERPSLRRSVSNAPTNMR